MDTEEEEQIVIIDTGSGYVKAGFGGDDSPRVVFPAVVGRPTHRGVHIGMGQKDAYVGDEAEDKRSILRFDRYPRYRDESGIITNWDNMEKILHHTFYNELRVAPEEHACLQIEPAMNPAANKEKMCEILFEMFNVLALRLKMSSICAMCATGTACGTVIDSGFKNTFIVPINDWNVLSDAVIKTRIGGKHVTQYLTKLFAETGYAFTTYKQRKWVRDIKEKLSYIAVNYDIELKKEKKNMRQEYELPDGNVICVDAQQRFRCAEILFKPNLIGNESKGIHELFCDAVNKCNVNMQDKQEIFDNIIFTGGNTDFDGFDDRFLFELSKMQSKINVLNNFVIDGYMRKEYRNVMCEDIMKMIYNCTRKQTTNKDMIGNRKYLSWIGASVLTSMTWCHQKALWLTKQEYDETGPMIVHSKQF